MSKLTRIAVAAVVAAAPLLAFASPAQAATGCAVNNSGGNTTNVTIVINPTSGNPVTIAHSSSAVSCEYITAGDSVTLSCTLTGGRCTAYVNNAQTASCTGVAGTSCTTTFPAAAGSTIRLEVVGGQGEVRDYVA